MEKQQVRFVIEENTEVEFENLIITIKEWIRDTHVHGADTVVSEVQEQCEKLVEQIKTGYFHSNPVKIDGNTY
jgi:hypothetical protein